MCQVALLATPNTASSLRSAPTTSSSCPLAAELECSPAQVVSLDHEGWSLDFESLSVLVAEVTSLYSC